jgi:hypothetical protein
MRTVLNPPTIPLQSYVDAPDSTAVLPWLNDGARYVGRATVPASPHCPTWCRSILCAAGSLLDHDGALHEAALFEATSTDASSTTEHTTIRVYVEQVYEPGQPAQTPQAVLTVAEGSEGLCAGDGGARGWVATAGELRELAAAALAAAAILDGEAGR